MPKTKISEFSSTPGNNTDIDGINIAEGCAPSGINDAIRELMSQLKDFQAGTAGDSFNGPVGTTTAAAGAFTTLTASSTATLNTLASSGATLTGGSINNMAIGGTTAAAGAFTTLSASSSVTISGGTANGVAYLNGSKVLTTGSALTFDGTTLSSTGQIIVGSTTTPVSGANVTVQGTAAGFAAVRYNATAASMPYTNHYRSRGSTVGTPAAVASGDGLGRYTAFGYNGTSAAYVASTEIRGEVDGTPGAADMPGRLVFATTAVGGTGVTERMRLDASGNLGLGVTPSAWGATLKAIQVGARGSLSYATGGTVVGQNYFSDGSSAKYIQTAAASALSLETDGSFKFFTAASGTAGNAISFTQAMTLDASGNLLVGSTNNPGTRRLSVNGIVSIQDGSNENFFINWNAGQSRTEIVTNGANSTTFWTNSTERARIDSSGNFLIGKTTTSGTTVGFAYVNGSSVQYAQAASTNANSTWETYSTGAGAYRFYVGMGGTIYATSTTITAISDQRLKENIQDIDVGLDAVMALKPRKFDWKEGKGKNKKGDRGWIAQEFEQVFPDMIDEWRDPAPEGEEPYKAVNADLIPVLVKAIQEQQAIINQLKADVAALKGN